MAQQTTNAWVARPWASRAIRVAVTVVPIVVSALTTRWLGGMWPRPDSTVGTIAWFLGMASVAMVVLAALDNVARRVLPLAALMQLTLLFPDEAPSRFSIAMRSGTTRQLERKLNDIEHGAHSAADASKILLELVAALRTHDRLTRGHSERVRAYTDLVAAEMGLSGDLRSKLHWAGLLHDIGKLRVPSEILNKKGRPTEDEWHILKQHPTEGAKLAAPLRSFLGESFAAIEQHHERWDGCGYPKGLSGSDISLSARIVSVVDTYDVMTSVRSYKEARKPQEARAELAACSGTQFDPVVVRAFLNISLGRLRLAMGPISWLAQGWVGGFAQAPIQTVLSSGQAATAASLLAAGSLAAPSLVDVDALGSEDSVTFDTAGHDASGHDDASGTDPGDNAASSGAPAGASAGAGPHARPTSAEGPSLVGGSGLNATSVLGEATANPGSPGAGNPGQEPLSPPVDPPGDPGLPPGSTLPDPELPGGTLPANDPLASLPAPSMPSPAPPSGVTTPTPTLPAALPASGTVQDAVNAASAAERFATQAADAAGAAQASAASAANALADAEESMVTVVASPFPGSVNAAAQQVFAAATTASQKADQAEMNAATAAARAASAQQKAAVAAAAAANNPTSSTAAQAAADAQAAASAAAASATQAAAAAATARQDADQAELLAAQAQAIVNAQ